MKHTPEPWDEDGEYLYHGEQLIGPINEFSTEDLGRIVACVNACAGISTETLAEGPTLAEVIRMRKNEYDKMKADADRLAGCLNYILQSLDDDKARRPMSMRLGSTESAVSKARAALAAHEEGRMDKDPETLEEALKVIKGWKRLYFKTLNKVATARADALREAADRAVQWLASQLGDITTELHPKFIALRKAQVASLTAAILANKQEESNV
jgi:hypothetical protein